MKAKTEIIQITGKRMKISVTPWFRPYILHEGKRKTALSSFVKQPNGHGIYIIKRALAEKPLYIGYSENALYKTLYRHFQYWEERNHEHATYKAKNGYYIRILIPPVPMVKELEQQLIQELQPRDNHLKYTGFQTKLASRETTDLINYILDRPGEDFSPYIDRAEEDDGELPF